MSYQVGYTLSKPAQQMPVTSGSGGHHATQKSGGVNFSDVLRSFQGFGPEEMLNRLRERFNTVSFTNAFARDAIASRHRNESRSIQISDTVLKNMANDPAEYKRVTEKIERWLSGAAEFEGMNSGAHQMGMSITEVGTLVWASGGGSELSDTEREEFILAWDRFIDAFLEWLRNRGENCTFELFLYDKVA
jgi:hypothetical protein